MSHDPLDSTTVPPPTGAPGGSRVPARLGSYRIDGPLGRGGMGEVYRGFDEALRRPVAIKRIALAHRGAAEARARFWREARAVAALRHPGVVRVYHIDEAPGGDLYLVMELIEGWPLSALAEGPWPAALAAEVGRQVADALAEAHAAGITHRDVKPANLLVEPGGAVRVVDFGLARRAEAIEDRVTATGARLGTPAYMAPEQVEGAAVGPPADVFAVGVVLYRLLAGVHPFARDSQSATALAVATAACRPLDQVRDDVPPALARVVARCLARDPADRFADGSALAAALAACTLAGRGELAAFLARRGGRPTIERGEEEPSSYAPAGERLTGASAPRPPRRALAVPVAAALALAGAVAVWLARPAPEPERPPPRPPPAALSLPPRPVVAVLGFATTDAHPGVAPVAADALRAWLDLAPAEVVSVPLAALAAAAPADVELGPDLDPRRLARPGRGPGNVDLAVTGTLSPQGGGLRAEVRLVDTRSGAVAAAWTLQAPDPLALGERAARAVAAAVGAELPATQPALTRSPEAYAAFLAAEEAGRTGDIHTHRRQLAWSLQLDPNFALARLEELALLRSERRVADLIERGRALLERPLPPHVAARARAWVAQAEGRGADAVALLHGVVEQWPFDVEAWRALLVLRFFDEDLRDLGEAERLARGLLALAPRDPAAASRLVRALAWRGRVDEAQAALAAMEVEGDPAFTEIRGELALYGGDYAEALARFEEALRRSAANDYAEHMALAARILAGDCERAAADALDRIDHVEATGRDANLDWTYSLASQALICRQLWPAAAALLDRWAAHSASGTRQVRSLRHRVALAAGGDPAAVARAVTADLEDEPDRAVRADLLRLLARVSSDAADLRDRAEALLAQSLDVAASPAERRAWRRAREELLWRADRLEGADPGDASLVLPAGAVRDEGDLAIRVTAMALRAEALEDAGRGEEARAAWEALRGLAYERLWVTDLWVTAGQRLEAGR